MAKREKVDLNLPAFDDLFSTQEERDDAKLKRIYEIPLDEIDEFPDHPFKVKDDEDMFDLVESIKERGIITPATLRKKEDGRYELLSGHRRKRACELAGVETLRAEVVEMSRDEAIIFMVDSNLQRTTILPSEKAFSYKMRLDAMKRQGSRTDLSSVPSAQKSKGMTSRELLGREVGESQDNVRRYIRLTELIPELLDLVDENVVAMRPAVELSYLPDELQYEVLDMIEVEQCTPSHAQTLKMRKMLAEDKLTSEVIESIMQEEKPNQKEKLVIKSKDILRLFPKDMDPTKREAYMIKALEHYNNFQRRRQQEQSR